MDDIFPGTGHVSRTWESWSSQFGFFDGALALEGEARTPPGVPECLPDCAEPTDATRGAA